MKINCINRNRIISNLKDYENIIDSNIISKAKNNFTDDDYITCIKYLIQNKIDSLEKFQNSLEIIKKYIVTCYKKGNSMRGKKRPEHSVLMSEKMKVIALNRSEEHINNLNIHLKEKYKEKRLLTMKIINENHQLSKDEIYSLYSKWNSDNKKSFEHKHRKIQNFFLSKKYTENINFINFKNKYENVIINEENFVDIFSNMMSIISSVSTMNPDNNMGSTSFFKRGFIIDLKNEVNGLTVLKTRSSYETKTIEFLEKNNIKYEYEAHCFYLEKYNLNYIPDFKLFIGDEIIWLEVKGYIRGEKHMNKIKNQLQGFLELNNTIAYIRGIPKNMEDIYDNILNIEKINELKL